MLYLYNCISLKIRKVIEVFLGSNTRISFPVIHTFRKSSMNEVFSPYLIFRWNTKTSTWIYPPSLKIPKRHRWNVKINRNSPIKVAFLWNHRGVPPTVLSALFRFRDGVFVHCIFPQITSTPRIKAEIILKFRNQKTEFSQLT